MEKYRGGGWVVNKVLTCLSDNMEVSFMSDRQKIAPWGTQGGGKGQNWECSDPTQVFTGFRHSLRR